ncbi:hypothetical protein PPERSA_10258 [Pseudocohnilembus persalinus]|uniref:Uncharacterized protein n=1 Tax=Pseudocohnilembus persalinus TaxID=266149 RepID=A0A0V0R042_PSEPJ|nr:hypothetical protein PPERSA_10258 [Pseudocohnilembus persalinus]|eukprot:KRX07870.1 hypothetical protein PPERSA_10258 [Pseudocohnilembus persalinus]
MIVDKLAEIKQKKQKINENNNQNLDENKKKLENLIQGKNQKIENNGQKVYQIVCSSVQCEFLVQLTFAQNNTTKTLKNICLEHSADHKVYENHELQIKSIIDDIKPYIQQILNEYFLSDKQKLILFMQKSPKKILNYLKNNHNFDLYHMMAKQLKRADKEVKEKIKKAFDNIVLKTKKMIKMDEQLKNSNLNLLKQNGKKPKNVEKVIQKRRRKLSKQNKSTYSNDSEEEEINEQTNSSEQIYLEEDQTQELKQQSNNFNELQNSQQKNQIDKSYVLDSDLNQNNNSFQEKFEFQQKNQNYFQVQEDKDKNQQKIISKLEQQNKNKEQLKCQLEKYQQRINYIQSLLNDDVNQNEFDINLQIKNEYNCDSQLKEQQKQIQMLKNQIKQENSQNIVNNSGHLFNDSLDSNQKLMNIKQEQQEYFEKSDLTNNYNQLLFQKPNISPKYFKQNHIEEENVQQVQQIFDQDQYKERDENKNINNKNQKDILQQNMKSPIKIFSKNNYLKNKNYIQNPQYQGELDCVTQSFNKLGIQDQQFFSLSSNGNQNKQFMFSTFSNNNISPIKKIHTYYIDNNNSYNSQNNMSPYKLTGFSCSNFFKSSGFSQNNEVNQKIQNLKQSPIKNLYHNISSPTKYQIKLTNSPNKGYKNQIFDKKESDELKQIQLYQNFFQNENYLDQAIPIFKGNDNEQNENENENKKMKINTFFISSNKNVNKNFIEEEEEEEESDQNNIPNCIKTHQIIINSQNNKKQKNKTNFSHQENLSTINSSQDISKDLNLSQQLSNMMYKQKNLQQEIFKKPEKISQNQNQTQNNEENTNQTSDNSLDSNENQLKQSVQNKNNFKIQINKCENSQQKQQQNKNQVQKQKYKLDQDKNLLLLSFSNICKNKINNIHSNNLFQGVGLFDSFQKSGDFGNYLIVQSFKKCIQNFEKSPNKQNSISNFLNFSKVVETNKKNQQFNNNNIGINPFLCNQESSKNEIFTKVENEDNNNFYEFSQLNNNQSKNLNIDNSINNNINVKNIDLSYMSIEKFWNISQNKSNLCTNDMSVLRDLDDYNNNDKFIQPQNILKDSSQSNSQSFMCRESISEN